MKHEKQKAVMLRDTNSVHGTWASQELPDIHACAGKSKRKGSASSISSKTVKIYPWPVVSKYSLMLYATIGCPSLILHGSSSAWSTESMSQVTGSLRSTSVLKDNPAGWGRMHKHW
jgi:hypothetical protein